MNIAFFLTLKRDVVWIPARSTMRQALERMEFHHYSAVPLLDDDGKFAGILTEGDLLWMLKHNTKMTFADTEHVPLSSVPRTGRPAHPVRINAQMEELFALASAQNFVPVVDDTEVFIGIVRRSAIIDYSAERIRQAAVSAREGCSDREDWLCVIDAHGRVAAIDGGAPASWIGRPFDECPGVRDEVRVAARRLARDRESGSPAKGLRRRVRGDGLTEPDFTLIALEAIPRRHGPHD